MPDSLPCHCGFVAKNEAGLHVHQAQAHGAPQVHGREHTYNSGCRCAECKQAAHIERRGLNRNGPTCALCGFIAKNDRGLDIHEAHQHRNGPVHGREGTYNRGCRCDECRAATRAGQRERRRRRGIPTREEFVHRQKENQKPHGTSTRYKSGCRCDDCRRGHARYERERRQRIRESMS